ncbi:uncharacterized protein LOC106877899 isoform X1 [Octopus bimaculoides]|uniref:Spaetzle domain-containing protein n=1 Tax=Octopus bimaculoides TaxID=37653 RepID=A0A0L8GC44_OCTBM|nr:uncharacterized protein LOC106877899 isoform X1 [Octopus bimaculoides]XP_052823039.1 uncharacterized protein LOC106877899 isoform X1 [Octopus bimaculoides]|eukprot:XP_014782433.1 PREDICTED: uncharacterized protein LOC106877899 [Octopus bimaculoides]
MCANKLFLIFVIMDICVYAKLNEFKRAPDISYRPKKPKHQVINEIKKSIMLENLVKTKYPGIFHTKKEIENKLSRDMPQPPSSRPEYEKKSCCQVTPSFQMLDALQNLDGLERPIIHFEDAYQVIPWVTCSGTGFCTECESRNRTISLLAWKNSTSLIPTFDLFSVPLYCTCIPG